MHKKIAFNSPINSVSFGQVAVAVLRELHKKSIDPSIFPIGGSVDLSSQNLTEPLKAWLEKNTFEAPAIHSRKDPAFKIWHLNGGMESVSEKQVLLSFYELDSPTKEEINVVKNNKTFFSSKYTVEVFKQYGADCEYMPLGFDSENFKVVEKKYFTDDRIIFNLCGKFEKRKNHEKVIRTWIKRFGNDKKYSLQCAVYNSFLKPEQNKNIFLSILGEDPPFNVQLVKPMPQNFLYNDFLNSGDIILGLSGGEGWALPEFQSVALGKHAVIMNAHAYKSWADEINSVLVSPSGKLDAHDGMFFVKGQPYNQGNIFDFNEDEFIAGCEAAVNRHEINPVNEDGLLLQKTFTYENTTNQILKALEEV
jgi:hypothetical protein